MNIIDHIFEPTRLFLVWHSTSDSSIRHRRIVGELFKDADSVSFRYLKGTDDYRNAEKEGFIGFPAFTVHQNGVFEHALDAFMSRLPPRKRADFTKYLAQYALPSDFSGSDLSLLGYTGARLASDGFELCPDFSDASEPVDIVLEVNGAQYNFIEKLTIAEGSPVQFEPEPDNEFDSDAIAIHTTRGKIGYVSRGLNRSLKGLLTRAKVDGKILRSSMRNGRLQLLVLVACR